MPPRRHSPHVDGPSKLSGDGGDMNSAGGDTNYVDDARSNQQDERGYLEQIAGQSMAHPNEDFEFQFEFDEHLPPFPSVPAARAPSVDEPMPQVESQQPVFDPIQGFPLVEIEAPRDDAHRAYLVHNFRQELLSDIVNVEHLKRHADQYPISVHDLRRAEVAEALLNDGLIEGQPYLLALNVTRHDWHPKTCDCIYTVNLAGGPRRGSAETLQCYFAGVPYALWEYWGERTRMTDLHVRNYVKVFNDTHFFRAITAFWLDDKEWLAFWKSRRVSGRSSTRRGVM